MKELYFGIVVLLFISADLVRGQGGTVFKTVIKEGNGPVPLPNQTVTVHYIGTLENGVKIDSSYDRNEPFQFRLQAGEVIPGWDAGVASMRVGERAKLEIAPEDAYGLEGIPGSIPPNATLTFDIELLGVDNTPGVPSVPAQPQLNQPQFQTQPQFGSVSSGTMSLDNMPGFVNVLQPQSAGFNPQVSFAQPQRPPLSGPDPNIRGLVASNTAFVSQQAPGQFPGQSGISQGGQDIFGGRVMPGQVGTAQGQAFMNGGFQQQQQQNMGSAPGQPFRGQVSFVGQSGSAPSGFRPGGIAGVQFGSQSGMSGPTGMPTSRNIPQGIPQGMSQGMPQGMSQGTPQGMPQGAFGMTQQQMQTGAQRFGMPTGQRGATGTTGPMGFRPGQTFPQGPVGGVPTSRGGPGDLAAMRMMEQRMMAARRMGMTPGAAGGRTPSMEEMAAMARIGMRGGPPRNGVSPDVRAMMAMRARMARGGGPAGFRRPPISPFVARRMMTRRRLFP